MKLEHFACKKSISHVKSNAKFSKRYKRAHLFFKGINWIKPWLPIFRLLIKSIYFPNNFNLVYAFRFINHNFPWNPLSFLFVHFISRMCKLSLAMLSIISSDFLQDVTQDRKTKVHFIKLHVPWEVLLFYAEELSFRAPLEVCTIALGFLFMT